MNTPHTRKKSPRAPSITLEEAIDRVERIYDREHLHAAPTDVVAQHAGYKGANNGAALAVLASVRYFGLVERPREGYLAVAKDFERFRFAPDERQRRSLLIGFLRTPPLYAELLDKYEHALPSDSNLRYELIERGFNPTAAEAALVTFRRCVEYADYYATADTLGPDPTPAPDQEVFDHVGNALHASSARLEPAVSPIPVASSPPIAPSNDMDSIPVRLPGGRRAWLVIPTPFFTSDKARLKAQIDLLLTQDEEDGH